MYLYTLLRSFLKSAPPLVRQRFDLEDSTFMAHLSNLRCDMPRSYHSPKDLLKHISSRLIFLNGYYVETQSLWKPDGRYIWDTSELSILLALHDIAIKTFGQLCISNYETP